MCTPHGRHVRTPPELFWGTHGLLSLNNSTLIAGVNFSKTTEYFFLKLYRHLIWSIYRVYVQLRQNVTWLSIFIPWSKMAGGTLWWKMPFSECLWRQMQLLLHVFYSIFLENVTHSSCVTLSDLWVGSHQAFIIKSHFSYRILLNLPVYGTAYMCVPPRPIVAIPCTGSHTVNKYSLVLVFDLSEVWQINLTPHKLSKI